MHNLKEYALLYAQQEHAVGLVVTQETVLAQAIAAARFVAGWKTFEHYEFARQGPITGEVVLSHSEWALIRPLFVLMVERQNAQALEASRTFGVEAYGRTSSEIEADIRMEMELIRKTAFCQDIVSVGGGDDPDQ